MITGPTLSAAGKQYHEMSLEGWQVNLQQSLVKNNDRRVFIALRILREKLAELKDILPSDAIEQLVHVPIWISDTSGMNAEFYFFKPYVYRNQKDPRMLNGVEFQNISGFINEQQYSPMLVLHELAHAYHKINYNNIDKTIMRAYKNAESEKLYRRVKTAMDTTQRAYALQNSFEYFAELTETYFGRNNYYPFDKEELKAYDPMGYAMIETVWGLD